MSYSIYYDKAFIKLEQKPNHYIPMTLVGDSNVYEWGSNKRARNWEPFYSGVRRVPRNHVTPEEILGAFERSRKSAIESNKKWREEYGDSEKYSDDRYGWFTGLQFYGRKKSTYQMLQNIVTYGVKQASTIKEFVEANVSIRLYVVDPENYRETIFDKYIQSEDEYLEASEKWGDALRITFLAGDNVGKRMRRLQRKKVTS